jgi:hypothetical protein
MNNVLQNVEIPKNRPILRGTNANVEEFLPLVPASHRSALGNVLRSNWWANNEMEPNKDLDRFIIRHSGNRYGCIIEGCEMIFDRSQRAVDHFRKEIEHRPYKCLGVCSESGW